MNRVGEEYNKPKSEAGELDELIQFGMKNYEL